MPSRTVRQLATRVGTASYRGGRDSSVVIPGGEFGLSVEAEEICRKRARTSIKTFLMEMVK